MKTSEAKARIVRKTAGASTNSANASTPLKNKSAKAGKAGTLKADDAQKPSTPIVDYSEALDLEEPTLEQVEQEISNGLKAMEQSGQALTEDAVLRNHALDDQLQAGPCARADFLLRLTHLRMDRLRLNSLSESVLSLMPALTHVYLQHNNITTMTPLAVLPALSFCALSYNRIEEVDGIADLPKLLVLDVSFNSIQAFDASQLPTSLRFLQVEGNPCMATPDARASLRSRVLGRVPLLRHLDKPLDEDSEDDDEDGDEEEEGGGEGVQGEGSTDLDSALMGLKLQEGALTSPRAAGGGSGSGLMTEWKALNGEGSRLVSTALSMLEDLERACMDASAGLVRASVQRSRDHARSLRESMEVRAASRQGSRPTSAVLGGARPGSGGPSRSELAQAPRGPSFRTPSPGGGDALRGGMATPPRPLSGGAHPSSSPLPRTPSGRGLLDPPLVTAGYAAAGGASPAQGRMLPASSHTRNASGSAGSMSMRAASPSGRPLDSNLAPLRPLSGRGMSPLPPTSGPAAVPGSREDRLEQAVAADLQILRSRLQGLVEPMAAAAAMAGASGSSTSGAGTQQQPAAAPIQPSTGPKAQTQGRGGQRGHSAGRGPGSRPGSGVGMGSQQGPGRGSRPSSAKPKQPPATHTAEAKGLVSNELAVDNAVRALHAEMGRHMEMAAARVAAQRSADAAMADDIRAMRASASLAEQLRQELSLKAALAAGPGAAGAVRAALRQSMSAVGGESRQGVVAAALRQHAGSRGPGAARGGEDAQTQQVRASLTRLEGLSTLLMAEHDAAVNAALGVVLGSEDEEVEHGGSGAGGAEAADERGPAKISKYQALLAARAARVAGSDLADVEEDEEEEEEDASGDEEEHESEEGPPLVQAPARPPSGLTRPAALPAAGARSSGGGARNDDGRASVSDSIELGAVFKAPQLPPNPFAR